jgi:hypothetical protein
VRGQPEIAAVSATAVSCSSGQIEPPPLLWVFSAHSSRAGARIVAGKNGCDRPTTSMTWLEVKIHDTHRVVLAKIGR